MSDPICKTCGHPRSNHPYRHPFVGPTMDETIKELEAENARLRGALYDAGSNLMSCISTIKFIIENVCNPDNPGSGKLFGKIVEASEKSVKKMETALRQKGEPDEK